MKRKMRRFSISKKMNLFLILMLFTVSMGIAMLSYYFNAIQVDDFVKRLSYNSAENFSASVNPEFFADLRKLAESEEYQKLRATAEQTSNESLIEDYLKEKGMWDEYSLTRKRMCEVIKNMEDIKYLYLIVLGDQSAAKDMYLLDDMDNPLYQTGNYQEREPELYGVDTSQKIEPSITTGKWGWLCSAYVPVKDADGRIVCHVGCDVDMEGSMSQRTTYLIYILLSALALMTVVLILSIIFFQNIFVKPMKLITEETKKFDPENCESYEKAGVIDLELNGHDEISDIYEAIQSTQMNMIDYLGDLSKMDKERQRYFNMLKQIENDIRDKEDLLDKMSMEAYRDELTQVGNKNAYVRKVDDLSQRIARGSARFAIAMVDLNNLKFINDFSGHKAGDAYIKGTCKIITDVFRHSQIFRIGGDEFVITMTGADYQNRDELVQQLKMRFYESYYNTNVPPHERYCAAVGIAVYESGDTVESVFKRADQSMYADKMSFKQKNGSYR